jgi:hypothetical protein
MWKGMLTLDTCVHSVSFEDRNGGEDTKGEEGAQHTSGELKGEGGGGTNASYRKNRHCTCSGCQSTDEEEGNEWKHRKT